MSEFTPKIALKEYNDLLDAVSKSEYEQFHYYVHSGSMDTLQKIVELNTPKKLVDPYDDGYEILSGRCPNCNLEKIAIVRSRFYKDSTRTNNSGNNYEDKANFEKVLMRFQGKQPDKPPLELYERLGEYFTDSETPKIDILGDKVGTMIYNENPFCFSITNKEIANSYKNYFEYLWKIAKK